MINDSLRSAATDVCIFVIKDAKRDFVCYFYKLELLVCHPFTLCLGL